MTKSQIKTIFFIYSEASLSVFMGIIAIIELFCAIILQFYNSAFSNMAYIAAGLFFIISFSLAYNVYTSAKKHKII